MIFTWRMTSPSDTPMNKVWHKLPDDLKGHICNMLPKVRKIPEDIKKGISAVYEYNKLCLQMESVWNINPYIGMGYASEEEQAHFQDLTNEVKHSYSEMIKWTRKSGNSSQ